MPGREVRVTRGVQRYVAINGKLWTLGLMSESTDVNPTDPKVTTFFDSFSPLE